MNKTRQELLDEIDKLREDLHRSENECNTIDALASSLGSAIGWDTPGETWVDKARFLKAFYVERRVDA
jgi:hypothetical protein